MQFNQFCERFGGSFRTKHLSLLSSWFSIGKFAARLHKRAYALPKKSGLPKDFIRLEPWEAEYLYLLASRARRRIVEVGRFRGGSTFLMAAANGRVPIDSIDIAPQDDASLRGYFQQYGVGENVNLIVGDSQQTRYPGIEQIDLLFIDGDHSYEGCTSDLENWYPLVVEGGHVILHDCYFGSPVQESVLDFLDRHPADVIRSPYIIRSHWQTSYGSLVHFIKKPTAATSAA